MQIIEEAKARGAAKAKMTKSMVVLDVKPWDDTTGEHPFKTTAPTYNSPKSALCPALLAKRMYIFVFAAEHCLPKGVRT